MNHILDLSEDNIRRLNEGVFGSIARGEAILFLGAGSSIGEKKFLSQQIMTLYSDNVGIGLATEDIVEFIDSLSADSRFDRTHFDGFVVDLLNRVDVSETHKTIARLSWREIITTNCDLVIERAFDGLTVEGESNLKLKPIRRYAEYSYNPSDDEVKYVKLNGCISDPKKYPLVFSTEDFAEAGRFYKTVLKSLENLSPQIVFISVGYSFSDPFAKHLLRRFDNYSFLRKRWIVNIDPFAQGSQLSYFTQNKICVVQCTAQRFFELYSEWESHQNEAKADRIRTRISRPNDQIVSVPADLKARLGNVIVQLSKANPFPSVDQESFYQGEEPTFDTIRKNHDVVREQGLNAVLTFVKSTLFDKHELVPIFALKGSYGTGKTTFAYRLAERLSCDPSSEVIAFEVLEPEKLTVADLKRLVSLIQAKHVVLVFNRIERDSNFKALVDLRNRISAEQLQDFVVIMIGSIRENILERYKQQHHYARLFEIDVDFRWADAEATDLVEKLKSCGLVKYRDARQRQDFVRKITSEYGDTFTSMVGLLTNSQHINYLLSAYQQLPKKAQDAFLFTSMLYRFGCLMPASLLKKLVSTDWDSFKRDVLEVDCKGILIQQISSSAGTDPDLYFRTKHPIVSDLLVKYFYPDDDSRFRSYLVLIQHISAGFRMSTMLVDVLKSIRDTRDLSYDKLDKLFDACSQEFGEDPHFTLHYAVNLQHRGDEKSIQEAISNILHVEGILDRRSHRLVHRRATLNFDMAKLTYAKEKELNETLKYVREARELFHVKLLLDPFSSYGHLDYIKFEIWCLDRINHSEEQRASQLILIEELIELAERNVFDDLDAIAKVKSDYLRNNKRITQDDRKAYFAHLELMHENENMRHLALILMFHYHRQENDEDKCSGVVARLEAYRHLDSVALLLFNYYGRRLHVPNNRSQLLRIVRENSRIAERNLVNYHFFLYVAAAYNHFFGEAYSHVEELRYMAYSPLRRDFWRDSETGNIVVYRGIITRTSNRFKVRIIELQQTFGYQLRNGVTLSVEEGLAVDAVLHFYLSGVRAEIIGKTQLPTSNP